MTTEELIAECRRMARQCIDAPKSKRLFDELADRLQDLDRIKYPDKSLVGSVPVVLYFKTQAEADELMRLVHEVKPHMIARSLE